MKAGAATSKTLRINRVSAFWANDRPGGLGITIPFEDPEVGLEVCRMLDSTLAEYDAHPEVTPEDYLAQLQDFGSRSGSLSDEEGLIALANIYWLQERGHLTTDEFNGLLFAWTVDGSVALMIGEQNPVRLDLHNAERDGIDVTQVAEATSKAGPFASTAAFTAVLDYARTAGRSRIGGAS